MLPTLITPVTEFVAVFTITMLLANGFVTYAFMPSEKNAAPVGREKLELTAFTTLGLMLLSVIYTQ